MKYLSGSTVRCFNSGDIYWVLFQCSSFESISLQCIYLHFILILFFHV